MAIHADIRAVEAVRSVLGDDIVVEIIVVNTGSGSLAAPLGTLLDHVVLVESAQLRLPGGTRNLGVGEARAPVIAFLAADCRATPGWVAARLAAHRGAPAVAAAMRPLPASGGAVPLASWASYCLFHCRRAPEYPEHASLRYGVSYARELFDRHGAFAEDRLIGEDTEFNDRLGPGDRPIWVPHIVTLHAYPATLRAAVADAFARGINVHGWMHQRRSLAALRGLRRAAGSLCYALSLPPRTRGAPRRALSLALPLVLLLSASYGAGVIAAGFGVRRAGSHPPASA